MLDNEFLRQKREREFQKQVLSGLDKPRGSRLTGLLNSPFTLWLLSLLVVTVGGAYFTTRNQCYQDADRFIDNYEKLAVELRLRQAHIRDSVAKAKSGDHLLTLLRTRPQTTTEYGLRSLRALRRQLFRYNERIHVVNDRESERNSIHLIYQHVYLTDDFTVDDAALPDLKEWVAKNAMLN